MAWLSTVTPGGQPVSVPVWFLVREDRSILIYSEAGKAKLRNLEHNPKVTIGLDVTDLGRDIVRIDGTAARATDVPPADQNPAFVRKYLERIAAIFGTVDRFAEKFSVPLIVTPTRLRA